MWTILTIVNRLVRCDIVYRMLSWVGVAGFVAGGGAVGVAL